MSRRMPRLEVIEAFIEAARAPSFRIAAEQCALSPAAFSRRIQAFSQFAGCEVFSRSPGGMRLTDAGRRCLERLEPIYLDMRRATLEIGRRAEPEQLSISLSHSLAVGWLIPRLDSFHARHPGVSVVVHSARTAAAIRSGDVDFGICAGDIDVTGLTVQPLMSFHISPVAAPAIAAEIRDSGQGVSGRRVLRMAQHPEIWPWWCEAAGVNGAALQPGPTFDVLHAMYEAAAAGLGVALGVDPTVEPHLRSGRLTHLGLPTIRHPSGYRLAGTDSRVRRPAVRLLWRWLLAEAQVHSLDWSGGRTLAPA